MPSIGYNASDLTAKVGFGTLIFYQVQMIAFPWPVRCVLTTVALAAMLAAACSCAVGDAPPATLDAGPSNVIFPTIDSNTPDLFDATATPVRTALPRDTDLLQMLDTIQPDQLLVTVHALAAMRTRSILSDGFDPTQGIGIDAARNFILTQFHDLKGASALQVSTQAVTVTLNGIVSTSDNIIARLPGTDPTAGAIVIGAHYDTQNAADPYSADLYAPGANDNASGIAALLAISQVLLNHPPRATVLLVAFTAGESGSQGSADFVNAYLNVSQPPIVPRAMLNLDTLGGQPDSTAKPPIRMFSADPDSSGSRQLARWLAVILSGYPEYPTPLVESQAERTGQIGDQQVFSDSAIPAVAITEGSDLAGIDRSPADTTDTVSPTYLLAATRAALIMADSLADGPRAPNDVIWHSQNRTLTWTPIADAAGYVLVLRGSKSEPDRTIVLPAESEFTSDFVADYPLAALSSVDSRGLIGQAAPEILLQRTR